MFYTWFISWTIILTRVLVKTALQISKNQSITFVYFDRERISAISFMCRVCLLQVIGKIVFIVALWFLSKYSAVSFLSELLNVIICLSILYTWLSLLLWVKTIWIKVSPSLKMVEQWMHVICLLCIKRCNICKNVFQNQFFTDALKDMSFYRINGF